MTVTVAEDFTSLADAPHFPGGRFDFYFYGGHLDLYYTIVMQQTLWPGDRSAAIGCIAIDQSSCSLAVHHERTGPGVDYRIDQ